MQTNTPAFNDFFPLFFESGQRLHKGIKYIMAGGYLRLKTAGCLRSIILFFAVAFAFYGFDSVINKNRSDSYCPRCVCNCPELQPARKQSQISMYIPIPIHLSLPPISILASSIHSNFVVACLVNLYLSSRLR